MSDSIFSRETQHRGGVLRTKRMRALAQKQANQCIPQYMDLPKMLPLLLEEGPDLILQP